MRFVFQGIGYSAPEIGSEFTSRRPQQRPRLPLIVGRYALTSSCGKRINISANASKHASCIVTADFFSGLMTSCVSTHFSLIRVMASCLRRTIYRPMWSRMLLILNRWYAVRSEAQG